MREYQIRNPYVLSESDFKNMLVDMFDLFTSFLIFGILVVSTLMSLFPTLITIKFIWALFAISVLYSFIKWNNEESFWIFYGCLIGLTISLYVYWFVGTLIMIYLWYIVIKKILNCD